MCKTMYWSERALLKGHIFIFKTRIKPSSISLTCCDLHIFSIWIRFCSFCWAIFQGSIWEGTTTSILWQFSIWHVSCLRAVCTPTRSSIQVMSATFGSCSVLIPELDFFCASVVYAAFFLKKQVSFFLLLSVSKASVSWKVVFRFLDTKKISTYFIFQGWVTNLYQAGSAFEVREML